MTENAIAITGKEVYESDEFSALATKIGIPRLPGAKRLTIVIDLYEDLPVDVIHEYQAVNTDAKAPPKKNDLDMWGND